MEMVEVWKKEEGEAAFNESLANAGYSNVTEYIDYWVNETFSLKVYSYSFSSDGTLFLQENLPSNKGNNELSGQVYHGGYNNKWVFTFAASTYTINWGENGDTETGSYAVDSIHKYVYFRPATYNDMNQEQYYGYEKQNRPNGDSYFVNNGDYWAASTNSRFEIYGYSYDKASRIIDYH